MALNKFVEFNAVKFLNDAKHWKDRKRKLMQELNAVTELKGHSDDAPTRSGRISDMTANVAAERMRIENKIKRLEKYEEALTYGLSMPPKEQNDVLRAFFSAAGQYPTMLIFSLINTIAPQGAYIA